MKASKLLFESPDELLAPRNSRGSTAHQEMFVGFKWVSVGGAAWCIFGVIAVGFDAAGQVSMAVLWDEAGADCSVTSGTEGRPANEVVLGLVPFVAVFEIGDHIGGCGRPAKSRWKTAGARGVTDVKLADCRRKCWN
jgi:hypothetical protein